MNRYQKTDQELRRILQPGTEQKAPEGFSDRIMAMVNAEAQKESVPATKSWRIYTYITATIVLGISLYFNFFLKIKS